MGEGRGRSTKVLLIGTGDTKSPELLFLRDCIAEAGGTTVFMDVGVLAGGAYRPDVSNEDVAQYLNFSDPANFRRSLKRWTGCTPNLIRQLFS